MTDNKTPEFMEYAAKRYMEHIANHDRLVATALCGVAEAKSKLGIAGVSYEPNGGGQPSDDRIPNALSRLHTALEDAEAELASYEAEMDRCKCALACIDDDVYRCLLKCRYVHGLSWRKTAECIGYSVQHAKAMRRHALIALYPHMPEEWKANLPNAEVKTLRYADLG